MKTFRSCVTLAAITSTKALWLDVPTRWNSTFMMLDRALLYRSAFIEMKKMDPMYNHLPEPDEWEKVEKVRDILEPFCDITKLFSGTDYPTANLYFENVWRIAMLLRDLSEGDDVEMKIIGQRMLDKFNKYWFHSSDDDYKTLFAFTAILDPRLKKQFLKYCYQTMNEETDENATEAKNAQRKASLEVNNVIFKLKKLFDEYTPTDKVISNNNLASSVIPSNRKRKYDLMDFDNEEGASLSSSSSQKTALNLYLDEPSKGRNENINVLHFWKENEQKYESLAHLARDILTVPLTTVCSESTFSIAGKILNKWRSSYLPENIEALITSRSWL